MDQADGAVEARPWDVLDLSHEAVHLWFNLTYANYLVMPRTLLQSMPDEWQERFVRCLLELDEAMADVPQAASYRVNAVDAEGKFTKDPVPPYNRGRTRVGFTSTMVPRARW